MVLTIEYFLLGLLAVSFLLQLYYVVFVYGKLSRYKVPPVAAIQPVPVSVIICARNEESNLRTNLPAILTQDYPSFEVIVVNDCSSDDTEWLLKDLAKRFHHLRIVHLKEHLIHKRGKKFAATIGIKAASHEHLVFTDADCWPQSAQWLRSMAGAFDSGAEIVLGYSPYERRKGLLNALIRFETFHTATSYLSYALKGNAYMGVGRNMAYLKSLFFRGKGFAAHMHIPSGDDDLFVNQNAGRDNTRICIDRNAHVWSIPKLTFSSYFQQKTRHHGAARMYRASHRWMLATQLISAVLFYLSVVICVVMLPELWELFVGILLIRWLVLTLTFESVMKKLQVADLLIWLPLLDLFFYFYIVLNGFFAFFRKNINWK